MSNLIAVFQIGSLGDSIVSLPSLTSIRDLIPGATDYLLVSKFDSTLKVMPAEVFDMVWPPAIQLNYRNSGTRLSRWSSVATLYAKLRYYRPKACVYLLPTDRSPADIHRDRGFFHAAGISNLHGFREPSPLERAALTGTTLHATEAYLRFARLWNESAPAKFPQYGQPPLITPRKSQPPKSNRPVIALAPYSNMPSKDLADDTIKTLLSRLPTLCNADVVIIGGKKDFHRAQSAIPDPTTIRNACGLLSIEESAALLKSCQLAICADSGPMHLAGAVGTPLLVIFSRVSKHLCRWFPIAGPSHFLYREVPCQGCNATTCTVQGHPCMQQITAEEILTTATKLMSKTPVETTTNQLNWPPNN